MGPIETVVLGLYFFVLVILAAFGTHRYLMIYLYYRDRSRKPAPAMLPDTLPRVTVQLPIFNELYVVERLLSSVTAMRYPRELLQIQVLDDSIDETAALASAAVEQYRQQGFDIQYLHRTDRTGFKAGALDAGLREATGEFILIFDADFIAPPDILERTLGHFADPKVAVVQARWEHLNRGFSLLTEIQSMLLDGHFVLEHGARSRSGRFFNFNGTAGVWRRAAIADAGGWQHDTLTEDLDLSYRAQLRGWRFVYLQDVASPAELPVEMNAFKNQQHRWAKGSVQACLKLLPRVLASDAPWWVKAEATFHLSGNLAYPLMLLLCVLVFPAMLLRYDMGFWEMLVIDVPLFVCATASVCSFYVLSEMELFGKAGWRRARYLPAALALGIGMSVNNAKAVFEALAGRQSEFTRTPKLGVERRADEWKRKRYHGSRNFVPYIELGLGLYFTYVAVYATASGLIGTLPFILLFQGGFLYASSLSLLQGLVRLPRLRAQRA